MSDLIPCRFCRFAPHAWLDDYINGRAVTDPEYIIECENGNCSVMPEVRGTYPYMDEVRAMWNAANALPAAQPDPREAALRDIARQKKSDEMDTEYDVEYAEFEGGYNAIIDVARVALRAVQPDTVQAQIDAAVLAERERCAVIADAQEARAAAREKEAPDDENDFANGLLFGTKIGARIIAAEIRKGDQPDAQVNETPKSEHDAVNMLTPATKEGA